MNDPDLQQLMQQARHAQEGLDWSRAAYGFETRLSARLREEQEAGDGITALVWRAVAGCAAVVGIMAVWFILAQAPQAAEDEMTAFWDGGQSAWDTELIN